MCDLHHYFLPTHPYPCLYPPCYLLSLPVTLSEGELVGQNMNPEYENKPHFMTTYAL